MWAKIWNILLKIFLQILFSFLGDYLKEIVPIAKRVVFEIANDPQIITDEEKRNRAFIEIKDELKTRGKIGPPDHTGGWRYPLA